MLIVDDDYMEKTILI